MIFKQIVNLTNKIVTLFTTYYYFIVVLLLDSNQRNHIIQLTIFHSQHTILK